jgi:hypothetical protein
MASKSHVALGSAPLVVRRCVCTRPSSGSFTISESGVNNRETGDLLSASARGACVSAGGGTSERAKTSRGYRSASIADGVWSLPEQDHEVARTGATLRR